MPGAHLTFGGSAAHRWLACPGSVVLCATLPPQRESEAMAEGTRAHALLEHCLREREDDPAGRSTHWRMSRPFRWPLILSTPS
jgi:hypothetical protein